MSDADRLFRDGVRLLASRDAAGAEQSFRAVLRLVPEEPAAWTNLGVALASLKRDIEAEQCHRMAIRLKPDYRNARFNLAYVLLRNGRYDEGWSCLEARDWYANLAALLPFPRWQGESLAGKRLLIGIEAGHGDMIQFCRYATLAKAGGATRVGVLAHPALANLLLSYAALDEIFPADQKLPQDGWDYWVPPLSLPYHFATRLDCVPAPLPYLSADPARIERWRPKIESAEKSAVAVRRVGVAWRGSVGFENDAERSLASLAVLAPLAEVPGVRFYSLHREARPEDLAPLAAVDLGTDIADFADTAAIIAQLDLVISVDTAVAHLAGAMAKPCWVLLPDYQTDWRWLSTRTDSPWYPGVMRLFRQPRRGDWNSVVQQVRVALDGTDRMATNPI
jgi:hypothetical protein